ncbi:MAG: hypothetical protein FWC91_07750 [Defluviitaleaceae bacterium]|nr:hypothetical protein [Defluviitaleaceae bacterium]
MILRKNMIFLVLAVLLLVAIASVFLSVRIKAFANPSAGYIELIEFGDFNDLTLIIYYRESAVFVLAGISEYCLINHRHEYKLTIPGYRLNEYADLLNQLNYLDLTPVEIESGLIAELHYMFKNKYGEKVFRVSMWGRQRSMFVNGYEVQEENILYEVILPFLPESKAERLQRYINNSMD